MSLENEWPDYAVLGFGINVVLPTGLGKPVMVMKDSKQREATSIDIDNDCHLKVRYENGDEEYLSSEEVSIKN